ncbi:hypothetical protein CJ030_MR2G003168 [Morella rubra]|uniref:Uncharacterized protein n=1 Tax=Morella rubra TaxID=262757 RepID=A0A6A1WDE5_9ROSI|nr:hypothetical protein CJ030_MR2G003168 [Morella rubra]
MSSMCRHFFLSRKQVSGDDVMPMGGKRLRHVRGSTHGIALLKAYTRGKLTVHIPNGCTGGDDKASSMLSSHIGALVQQHVPFETSKWKEVPDERRSAINKENRAKLKIVHTSGARSFQRARALLEKMEALQLQHESEGKSYTEVEIFAEVLGTKAGYVRGLGCSVRASGQAVRYGADDARASANDGGATTEERRRADADDGRVAMKKDEEHQKMMEEQQRSLVEQQERRMQLMAEQMREQLMEQIRQLQSRSTPK